MSVFMFHPLSFYYDVSFSPLSQFWVPGFPPCFGDAGIDMPWSFHCKCCSEFLYMQEAELYWEPLAMSCPLGWTKPQVWECTSNVHCSLLSVSWQKLWREINSTWTTWMWGARTLLTRSSCRATSKCDVNAVADCDSWWTILGGATAVHKPQSPWKEPWSIWCTFWCNEQTGSGGREFCCGQQIVAVTGWRSNNYIMIVATIDSHTTS